MLFALGSHFRCCVFEPPYFFGSLPAQLRARKSNMRALMNSRGNQIRANERRIIFHSEEKTIRSFGTMNVGMRGTFVRLGRREKSPPAILNFFEQPQNVSSFGHFFPPHSRTKIPISREIVKNQPCPTVDRSRGYDYSRILTCRRRRRRRRRRVVGRERKREGGGMTMGMTRTADARAHIPRRTRTTAMMTTLWTHRTSIALIVIIRRG